MNEPYLIRTNENRPWGQSNLGDFTKKQLLEIFKRELIKGSCAIRGCREKPIRVVKQFDFLYMCEGHAQLAVGLRLKRFLLKDGKSMLWCDGDHRQMAVVDRHLLGRRRTPKVTLVV